MAVCLVVYYIPCATSSREQTGNIITFTQFKEVNLLSETREDVESDDEIGDKSNEDSIMLPLLSLEEKIRWILVMTQMMNLCLRRC